MSAELPQDDLLQRYERAKAALPDGLPTGPSAAVRERIMQAAREQANAIKKVAPTAESTPPIGLKSFEKSIKEQIQVQAAANDSFWNIRALGSLAVMGLAGLLWWQFEHGTPEEQLAARSAKPSAAVEAAAPAAPALEAAAPTRSATTPPASPTVSVAASIAPPAAALPPLPALTAPVPAAPLSSDAQTAANPPEKLAQAKIAAQSRSKAETAEIATPNASASQAAAPASLPATAPAPSPAPQAARAPAQETPAAATASAQIPQTDKAMKDASSRAALPNLAAEPSLQRSLETTQAPEMAAAPSPAPAAARAAAPPRQAAPAAPRAAPAAGTAAQAASNQQRGK